MRLKRFHLKYRDHETYVEEHEILLPLSRCRQVRRALLKDQTSKCFTAPIVAIKGKRSTIFRFFGENAVESEFCSLGFESRKVLEIQDGEEISLNIIYNPFIGYFLFLTTHPTDWIRSTTRLLVHICLGLAFTCLFSLVTYIFGIDVLHTKGGQAAFTIHWPVMLRLWKKFQKSRF